MTLSAIEKEGRDRTYAALQLATSEPYGRELSESDFSQKFLREAVRTTGADKKSFYIPGFWAGYREFLENEVLKKGSACISTDLKDDLAADAVDDKLTKGLVDRLLAGGTGFCGTPRSTAAAEQSAIVVTEPPVEEPPLSPFQGDDSLAVTPPPVVPPVVVGPPPVVPPVVPPPPVVPRVVDNDPPPAPPPVAPAAPPQRPYIPPVIASVYQEVLTGKGKYRPQQFRSPQHLKKGVAYLFFNATPDNLFKLVTSLNDRSWMGSEITVSQIVGGSVKDGYIEHYIQMATRLQGDEDDKEGLTMTFEVKVRYTWQRKPNGGWLVQYKYAPLGNLDTHGATNISDEEGGWEIDPYYTPENPADPASKMVLRGCWARYWIWFDPQLPKDTAWPAIKKSIESAALDKGLQLFRGAAKWLDDRGLLIGPKLNYTLRTF